MIKDDGKTRAWGFNQVNAAQQFAIPYASPPLTYLSTTVSCSSKLFKGISPQCMIVLLFRNFELFYITFLFSSYFCGLDKSTEKKRVMELFVSSYCS
ncbi:hypothetical protein Pint_08242 [Pistacia integerrima]|uniref:Uncharacterized protein n=1 Tax=Pistacia integerrima TaxID=434235 RepID=A0ACC0XX62_9ROSI|nr:hypothetical protein Pint_08242 [Pistacia integerrima]